MASASSSFRNRGRRARDDTLFYNLLLDEIGRDEVEVDGLHAGRDAVPLLRGPTFASESLSPQPVAEPHELLVAGDVDELQVGCRQPTG
jgi:hypothetical protein